MSWSYWSEFRRLQVVVGRFAGLFPELEQWYADRVWKYHILENVTVSCYFYMYRIFSIFLIFSKCRLAVSLWHQITTDNTLFASSVKWLSTVLSVNVPNRYSHVLKCMCWRPVMHAQTWTSYNAVYRFRSLLSSNSYNCYATALCSLHWQCFLLGPSIYPKDG